MSRQASERLLHQSCWHSLWRLQGQAAGREPLLSYSEATLEAFLPAWFSVLLALFRFPSPLQGFDANVVTILTIRHPCSLPVECTLLLSHFSLPSSTRTFALSLPTHTHDNPSSRITNIGVHQQHRSHTGYEKLRVIYSAYTKPSTVPANAPCLSLSIRQIMTGDRSRVVKANTLRGRVGYLCE